MQLFAAGRAERFETVRLDGELPFGPVLTKIDSEPSLGSLILPQYKKKHSVWGKNSLCSVNGVLDVITQSCEE